MGCLDMNTLKAHNYPVLYHFTQADNLESIFKYGLMTRADLESTGLKYAPNDMQRLDGHPDTISLSISWPNSKMLYTCQKKPESKDKVWVVLDIDPRILCDKRIPCAYCWTNAADKRISSLKFSDLCSKECFEQLFLDNPFPQGDEPRTRDERLYSWIPTNPQAEILVQRGIDSSFIRNVYFPAVKIDSRSRRKELTMKEYLEEYAEYIKIIPEYLRRKFHQDEKKYLYM